MGLEWIVEGENGAPLFEIEVEADTDQVYVVISLPEDAGYLQLEFDQSTRVCGWSDQGSQQS